MIGFFPCHRDIPRLLASIFDFSTSLFLIFLFLLSSLVTSDRKSLAQSTGWSIPSELRMSGPEYGPGFPIAVCDAYGRIHVFLGLSNSFGESGELGGTINYTMYDREGWSTPVDVLAADSLESPVGLGGVSLASSGQMYALWWAEDLYLSSTDVSDAGHAGSWSTQYLLNNVTSSAMLVVDQEVYVFSIVSGQPQIVIQGSYDGGTSWADELTILPDPDQSQAKYRGYRDVNIVSDAAGTLHLVWCETDVRLGWGPSAICYVRSFDKGQTWQDFYAVRDEGSYPALGFDADGNIHMIWDHNITSGRGIGHCISRDGGTSWGDTQVFVSDLNGRTGRPQMVLDAAGDMHVVLAGAGRGTHGSIYHTILNGSQWTPLELVSEGLDLSEGPSLVLVDGSTLFAVWRDLTRNDVFYSQWSTGAPHTTPYPTPLPEEDLVDGGDAATEATDSLALEMVVPTRAVSLDLPQRVDAGSVSSTRAVAVPSLVTLAMLSLVILLKSYRRIQR